MSPRTATETRRRTRLVDLAAPLFSIMVVLRKSADLDLVVDLRTAVERTFAEFRRRALEEGAMPADVDAACYALAATLDEILLEAEWEGKREFQNKTFGKTHCGDEFVGVGFYDKLAVEIRRPPPRTEVIEVFYYCLVMGFQGMHVNAPKKIADLVSELAHEIAPGETVLSPPTPPEQRVLEPIRKVPVLVIATVGVCVPMLVWLISEVILQGRARSYAAGLAEAIGKWVP